MSATSHTPDWHARRLTVIGGSEIALLFGLQPYGRSIYALWHEKAGIVAAPDIGNERMAWGLRLERAIAEGAAEQSGWTIRPGWHATDPTTPGLGATLDFVIDENAAERAQGRVGPGVLEVKNVDWLQHKRAWDDEPPLNIELQLQHQLASTGYTWGAIAALIGGNELAIHYFAARPKIIAAIRERVTAFWASIRDNKPPEPDGAASISTIRALYPDIMDQEADLTQDNELPELCADFLKCGEARKAAAKAEDEAKSRIFAKLADHKRALSVGFRISQSVTAANPGRPPEPGELIGKRAESRRLNVKEVA